MAHCGGAFHTGFKSTMTSIELNNVSVIFPIYDSSTRSLKNQLLPASLGGRIDSNETSVHSVYALNDINLTLFHGDRLGLVGHNGAGKTTLLRVLAGIYEPCSGSVNINGHIAPLFDIHLGMDPEATGYENILLRSIFLGLTRKDILSRIDEIATFTGLGEFLNLPLRTYSAGMRMRLAFSVCTSLKPEILLLDEGIGAGDAAFLDKAEKRLSNFTAQAGILVLASHSDDLIRKMCNRAVLMNRGKIIFHGHVEEVLEHYKNQIQFMTDTEINATKKSNKIPHMTSSTDSLDNKTGVPEYLECVLNWAENNYENLFNPHTDLINYSQPYYYRSYVTGYHLGVSCLDSHVYVQDPHGTISNMGLLNDWAKQAGCIKI